MNGFNIAAEDSLDIVDKFNEVSNNFSISSGGIGEALQRSASSLSAANNSLDQSIALITAANTIVQDPDSVGTAFKTKLIINCLYVQ
jgi:TP901 family phage tail tape measure protein